MSEELTDDVAGNEPADGAPPQSPDAGMGDAYGNNPAFQTNPPADPQTDPAYDAAPPSGGDVQVEAPAVAVAAPAPEDKSKKKKRKIDLKSRLSSVRAAGSISARASSPGERKSDPLSFPPPPVSGSVPAPKIAGVAPMQVSSAFAPPEPEKKVSAVAQTIKVEVGEEIHQERAKARKKTMIYVALAGVAALVIGFFLGVARQKGVDGHKAVENAGLLANDVEAANKTMSDMSDSLRRAAEQLGNDEFPDALVESLKSTNVDFSGENLMGRSVGGLPADTFNLLLTYTNGVEKLNKQKDTLRNLLTQAKPLVEQYVKEKGKPVVKFAITFSKAEKNDVGRLVSIDKPFEVAGEWPQKFTVVSGSGKDKEEAEVELFTGKLAPKVAVPIDPKSSAQFTDISLLFKLRAALNETRVLIDGQESPNPAQQTDGLLKEGKNLHEMLKKTSRAGS